MKFAVRFSMNKRLVKAFNKIDIVIWVLQPYGGVWCWDYIIVDTELKTDKRASVEIRKCSPDFFFFFFFHLFISLCILPKGTPWIDLVLFNYFAFYLHNFITSLIWINLFFYSRSFLDWKTLASYRYKWNLAFCFQSILCSYILIQSTLCSLGAVGVLLHLVCFVETFLCVRRKSAGSNGRKLKDF